MAGTTNTERIINLLAGRSDPLNDDEISKTLKIRPRQQVNQICHRLVRDGVLRREDGLGGKIVNILLRSTSQDLPASAVPSATRTSAMPAQEAVVSPPQTIAAKNLAQALLILPCSGKKTHGGSIGASGHSITEILPSDLREELLDARRRARLAARIDESRLMPAWQRYTGSFYQTGGHALENLIRRDCHVLILSGGYGVVLATEFIGYYEAVLNLKLWPNRLLERVIEAYATINHLRSARAFASRTTAYQRVVKDVSWRAAGVSDALLVTPDAVSGALVKSPSAQGEALEAFVAGTLTAIWSSSTGLGIAVTSLA